jgi:hypothetical protein
LNNGAVFVAGLWAGLTWTLGPGQGVVPLLVSGGLALVAGLVLVIGRHRVTGAVVPLA